MHKIDVFYSREDEGYIAIVPELPGCSAFGETREEALKEIEVAKSLWLAAEAIEGRNTPVPHDNGVGHRLTV